MASSLTAESFGKLLACFDLDRDRAGEKYEELRRAMIRFFEWRGAPFPEDHTDEAFNRVARKLDQGLEIRNIRGYCYEVARLLCLEALNGVDSKRDPLGPDQQNTAVIASADEAAEREIRLACLDSCMDKLPADGRRLILEYYRDDRRDRIDRRKDLAATLGLNREALANRAQRLRYKLEQCINRCFNKKMAI
ncbi:MAG TPA: sigma-70 family RNA polymerase sigma factor [Blastocatellia bacterium]